MNGVVVALITQVENDKHLSLSYRDHTIKYQMEDEFFELLENMIKQLSVIAWNIFGHTLEYIILTSRPQNKQMKVNMGATWGSRKERRPKPA